MGFKIVPLTNGGTGATSAAAARTALDVYSKAESAALEGLIPESAGTPAATPAAGTVQAYRDTNDGSILKYKTSAGAVQKFDSLVGTAASFAALEAAYPAATHAGRWAVVTGTGTESGLYQVVTGAWALKISANVYSKTEVDNLDEWEVTGGKLQPKSAYAGDTMRIGTATTGYSVSGSGSTAGTFTGTTTAEALVDDGGYLTANDSGAPKAIASGGAWGGYPEYKAFDGNAGTAWQSAMLTPSSGNPAILEIEYRNAHAITAIQLVSDIAWGTGAWAKDYTIDGFNGATWDTLLTRTNDDWTGTGESGVLSLSTTGAYTKYRLRCTANQAAGNNLALYAFRLLTNDVTTAYVYSGSAIDFVPGTLLVTADGVNVADGSGKVQIAYSKNSAAYTAYQNIEDFRASATITSVTDLKIRVKHLTVATINTLSISTPGSEILFSPSGLVQIKIDGIVVWEANSSGDMTGVDSIVQTLTALGYIKSTLPAQLVETTTPSTVAGVTQVYPKNDGFLYFKDGSGNERKLVGENQARNYVMETRVFTTTSDATQTEIFSYAMAAGENLSIEIDLIAVKGDGSERAVYKKHGLFYRDGSGNTTLLGSLANINATESDANWDGTIEAVTSPQKVSVKVTGFAATTVRWQGIIKYHSVLETATA